MESSTPALEIVNHLPVLPPRSAESNKGTYGRVLVIAGSRGMSGAAVLCGGAALRGGAGLVQLAVPQSILPIVAAANPCYLTAPLPEDKEGRLGKKSLPPLLELLHGQTVTVLGPGLGQSPDLPDLLAEVL